MLVRLLPVNMRSDTEWPGDNVHKTQRPTNGINQTVGEDIWAQGAFVYAVFAFKRRLFSINSAPASARAHNDQLWS